jgi:Immunity protein 53
MTSDLLPRLMRWYADHCDGEWEHDGGISITTVDNPGWWVKVRLARTGLAGRDFAVIAENIDTKGFPIGSRWLHCCLREGQWHGAGDETRLEEIVSIFLDWAEA